MFYPEKNWDFFKSIYEPLDIKEEDNSDVVAVLKSINDISQAEGSSIEVEEKYRKALANK